MTSESATPTPAHYWFQFRLRTLLVLPVVVGLLLLLPWDVRHDFGWIDPVTGSTKRQTRWLGFPTSTQIDQSAIEQWIVRQGGQHTNQWGLLYDTSLTAYGHPVARGCGLAPEIYDLHAGDFNDRFVSNASDQEIGEFVRIMRTGTDAEKTQAVKVACDKLLAR